MKYEKTALEYNELFKDLDIELQPAGQHIEKQQCMRKQRKLRLWAKFINHQYASFSALYELITREKPPKMKETQSIISGHIDKER